MRDRSRRRSIDWLDPDAARRRELRRFVGWSAAAHALVLGALAWSPGPGAPKLPGVVTVDLVAMAAPASGPASARAARAPSPRAPARPQAAPKPIPKPEPPKPAPRPEPPRREAALPKPQPAPEPKKARERAQADPKPEPEPGPRPEAKPREPAKPQPPPKPKPARAAKPPEPPKPPREEEAYDDVLAELRAERGESRPAPVASAAPAAGVAGATGVAGASARGAGQPLDADVAFWLRAAKLHVESAWILPPGIQRAALRTVVSVRLDEGGRVLGAPRVTERSANPWYDESVVRAIQKASPLPPPPESGEWRFEFTPPGSAG